MSNVFTSSFSDRPLPDRKHLGVSQPGDHLVITGKGEDIVLSQPKHPPHPPHFGIARDRIADEIIAKEIAGIFSSLRHKGTKSDPARRRKPCFFLLEICRGEREGAGPLALVDAAKRGEN